MPTGFYPRLVKRHEITQPLDKSYRFIPLTRNQNAVVDVKDFKKLSEHFWYAEWCPGTKSYYAVRKGKKKDDYPYRYAVRMHRVILGCKKNEQGDHKNHDTLDNRRKNLRKCSFTENRRNSKPWKTPRSGLRGVKIDGHRFVASIKANHRFIHLGQYGTAKEAARAYDKAAKKYHGDFAYLNFPH